MEPMGSVRPLEAVLLREGPFKTHQGLQRLLMDISQPIENSQMSQAKNLPLLLFLQWLTIQSGSASY